MINNIKKVTVSKLNLIECIKWANNKPMKIIKIPEKTIGQQKKYNQQKEKEWGNLMIGQEGNCQWTTLLGENLVFEILKLKGENPRKPGLMCGFKPDIETDDYIYEVKTSSWWVDGTAGEKVFGTWIKYQNVSELIGKPIRIVCVANQEWELEYGKVKYFGDEITEKTKKALELAREWGIEYIRFSDLIQDVNYK